MNDIVYGRNAVLELLDSSPDKVEKIYFQFNTSHNKLKEIMITARRLKIPVGKARLEKLGEIAGTTKHQGVCALVSSITYYTLDEVLAAPRNSSPFLVLLPGLQDPHNVGAIIRSAEAAAADAVVLLDGKGAPVNAVVHKASAGALSHMRVVKVKSLRKTLQELREKGFAIVAADMDAEINYTDVDYRRPTVFLMGEEGRGLLEGALAPEDTLVRIPMAGCVESLNVSVTAGVLCFELMRQRLS
ncbi:MULTISPECIES: 23S rRNA (guanosine(2251)-2'-O)-methyltransferase RlmB [Prosthecochloris]|uniref:23S rRNA (Guanosine(2251)-2'-O)-methyltransferase RlmB n=1 Tax=Prosthecochloris vibrioformis TaxID=1098 RepID=A0A5C4S1X3_PROVB|nr:MULTISPECIES: 23S rRNA (guanosine(2251)-2'-O)-methyltransferase RlmB [Prosthecochloris]ANT64353.1 Putative TrmH family tRNA/rRNA methyltransferase [Prosthecochloris sp. CIB 2401]TNJ37209.1 23S rRNA (guanosine(2251)-2'-O)-methyltransferase RlmB [Prosthecochloris vibrioformis]